MRTANLKLSALVMPVLVVVLLLAAAAMPVWAQTPVPGDGTTLSSFLEEIVTNFVAFKSAFINTVEGTLGGYFAVLAYILAWVIAVYYFVQQFIRGEWDASQIGRFTGSLVVCLLLLLFCGDLDGDGKRGDIVRTPAYLGYYLAFGEDAAEPTGSYINRLVNAERTKFNTNYQSFVENKLMVKINDQDMPVRYPGMTGIQTVAAVSIGQASAAQQNSVMSQEFWIGLLFQVMNFCRSVIEIVDFFLLVLYAFGILVCSIIAPFMAAPFVNRELRQRFTYPFLWTVFTITVIFPFLSQTFRYFAYLSSNIALGTSGNPIYTFDPQTYTIIAGGDPTPMILVAVLTMLISIVLLAMSLVLSYSFAQGKLVESMGGLIANTFAGISAVGIGAAVSSAATKISAEADKTQIAGALESTMTGAGYTQRAQQASAEASRQANQITATAGYQATMTNAAAQRVSSQTSSLGSFFSGSSSVAAENYQSVNSQLANFRHNLSGMDAEEKKAYADNFVDMLSKNNDATSQRIAKVIEQEPEKLDMLAEQYENFVSLIPVGGSVAKQFGLNKETMNSWMRTGGVKDFGQWVLGDPATGKGGAINGLSIPGSNMDKIGKSNQQFFSNDSGAVLTYQRPDGTLVDPLTGKQLSSNMVDMTDPNNVVDYSKSASVAGISNGPSRPMPQIRTGGRVKPSKEQQANIANLNRLRREDPNFLPALQQMAWRNGWDPNEVLNTMAFESSFNKSNRGGDTSKVAGGNFVGLIQFGESARKDVGLPKDAVTAQKQLAGMSATQQLPYVEKYLKGVERSSGVKLNQPGFVYGAIAGGAGAVQKASKNGGVVIKSGTAAYNAGGNKAWDADRNGQITYAELSRVSANKLGAGQFFDAGAALGQIRAADPAKAKVLGKKFSADATYYSGIENNRQTYEGKNQATGAYFADKRQAEANFAQESVDIANNKSKIQQQGVQTQYDYSIAASNVTYGGQSEAAKATYGGQVQAGQINYQGSVAAANLQFQGAGEAAQITQKAALDALYKRNLANLVQSVGGSAAHQFSELFERASKGF